MCACTRCNHRVHWVVMCCYETHKGLVFVLQIMDAAVHGVFTPMSCHWKVALSEILAIRCRIRLGKNTLFSSHDAVFETATSNHHAIL